MNNSPATTAVAVVIGDSTDTTTMELHDAVSLGYTTTTTTTGAPHPAAMHRLPYWMRLLSASRSLVSIPPHSFVVEDGDWKPRDPVVQAAVETWEDCAALYSVAEGIEVVACHVAPSVCRRSNIGKLPPLMPQPRVLPSQSIVYDTQALESCMASPHATIASSATSFDNANGSKHKRLKKSHSAEPEVHDIQHPHEEDDDDEEQGGDIQDTPSSTGMPKRRRPMDPRRTPSIAWAAEDTQEGQVTKTLSELVSLVVQSLPSTTIATNATLTISMDDSMLAEPRPGSGGGGAMMESDVCATVASLLHYAPVLQYEHVAVRNDGDYGLS
jgi:hypothetical protein